MRDNDARMIWGKYTLRESYSCAECGEDDPHMFEPGRKKYCKRCRAGQARDRARLATDNPRPPSGTVCPTCKQVKPLVLHHNHATGEFGGYICNDCNLVAGRAGDDPNILRRLADWITT